MFSAIRKWFATHEASLDAIDRTEIIIGLCARAQSNNESSRRLASEIDHFKDWEKLLSRAEFHGMSPLMYCHLKDSAAGIPAKVQRSLQANYIKQQFVSKKQQESLAEIIHCFNQRRIPFMILKGAALASLIYPEPGLRPMQDIDLLVGESDASRAQNLLLSIGFRELQTARQVLQRGHHHLPLLTRRVEGVQINVEVHTDLFPKTRFYRSRRIEDLIEDSIPISVQGVRGLTLGLEDMIWHVYRHATGPPLLATPLRFIYISDLVSLVETFLEKINWERLKRVYPQFYHVLPYLHYLTPLSESLLSTLRLDVSYIPKEIGQDYQGWPRQRLKGWQERETWDIVRQSLNPPDWWLHVYYGINGKGQQYWCRFFRHPLHLLEWIGHYTKEKFINQYG